MVVQLPDVLAVLWPKFELSLIVLQIRPMVLTASFTRNQMMISALCETQTLSKHSCISRSCIVICQVFSSICFDLPVYSCMFVYLFLHVVGYRMVYIYILYLCICFVYKHIEICVYINTIICICPRQFCSYGTLSIPGIYTMQALSDQNY